MMERMRKGGGEEPKQLKQIFKKIHIHALFWSGGLVHQQFNIATNALRIQTGIKWTMNIMSWCPSYLQAWRSQQIQFEENSPQS